MSEDRPICGIIMPISGSDGIYTDSHWARVRLVLEGAIQNAGMKPQAVWEEQSNDVIHARILKNIYENFIVICDVSSRNPNVMLELGMRLSTKKPTVLVADRETTLPFDTSIIGHVFYPRDLEYTETSKFVTTLSATVSELRRQADAGSYVSFVENFTFETVVPTEVSVSVSDYHLERLNEIGNAVNRIEERLGVDFPKTDWVQWLKQGEPSGANFLAKIAAQVPELRPGQRVSHAKFGFGTVVEVDGHKALIDFDTLGQKRVIDAFLKVSA